MPQAMVQRMSFLEYKKIYITEQKKRLCFQVQIKYVLRRQFVDQRLEQGRLYFISARDSLKIIASSLPNGIIGVELANILWVFSFVAMRALLGVIA
jgi:hypothetical protein